MTVIARLLAATPLPPAADIEGLLAAFEQMFVARTAILAEVVRPHALTDLERDQVAEIHLRDAAWQQAFTEARRKITDQRLGVHRLRAYAMP